MNAFRVIFLTLVFAVSMLFLVQNSNVLDTPSVLFLDLWWTRLSSPEIAFYVFVFLCFVAGLLFGAFTFYPGNRYLLEKLRPLRARLKKLTREIADMHKEEEKKKEEILKQEKEEQQEHTEEQPVEQPIEQPADEQKQVPEDQVARPGGTAGRLALVGVLAVFILLSVFYFYVDQRLADFRESLDASLGNIQAVETNIENTLAQVEVETALTREELGIVVSRLEVHDEQIAALQNLPQDTMDFLTLMMINEYMVTISQLIESAAADIDREKLESVQESLERALDHYRQKVE